MQSDELGISHDYYTCDEQEYEESDEDAWELLVNDESENRCKYYVAVVFQYYGKP